METTKSKRGGARAGAGRKPKSAEVRTETINCKLTKKAMTALESMAASKGVSKNEVINSWLESL